VKLRIRHSTYPRDDPRADDPGPENPNGIPIYPVLDITQYGPPDAASQLLLICYARHILRQPHPNDPKLEPFRVRIYRATHQILRPQVLAAGADPQSLIWFTPYYMGMYDAKGKLLDPDSPLLYWQIPILKRHLPGDDRPQIWVFPFKHAGEKNWILQPDQAR
jgi:hypothetical protein